MHPAAKAAASSYGKYHGNGSVLAVHGKSVKRTTPKMGPGVTKGTVKEGKPKSLNKDIATQSFRG